MLCTLKFSDLSADKISLQPAIFVFGHSAQSGENEPSIFTNSSRVCLDEPTNPTDSKECRLARQLSPCACLLVSQPLLSSLSPLVRSPFFPRVSVCPQAGSSLPHTELSLLGKQTSVFPSSLLRVSPGVSFHKANNVRLHSKLPFLPPLHSRLPLVPLC